MTGDCGSICPASGDFYSYNLSVGGNAVLLAAFAGLSLVVTYLGIRSWTPLFSVTLIAGLLAEVLAFVGRVLLHSTKDSQTYFFLFLLGTVLGPTFISTAIFIVLPHVLGIYGDPTSPFKPLVAGISFCILIFVAYESSNVSRSSGAKITAVGLAIQAFVLLACSALHFWFTLGLSTRRGSLDARHYQVYTSSGFRGLIMGIEVAIALLIVYSIYRIVEFAEGVSGTLFQNQTAFMIVGGAFPLIASAILTIFHPGPIFGDTWVETTPRGIKRRSRPPPIQYPDGHDIHHRYDPNIRSQISPASQKPLRNPVGPPELPAGSPGLPSSPRPISKASSPRTPRHNLVPSPEPRFVGKLDSKVMPQPAKAMVNSEELW